MVQTTLKVDGMMCSMCESHVNEVVRKTAQVEKVTSRKICFFNMKPHACFLRYCGLIVPRRFWIFTIEIKSFSKCMK